MFDRKEFVESVIEKRLSLDEIVSEARAEILYIESRPTRPVGSGDYARFLRILVFLLISEVKVRPANLSDDDFRLRLLFRVAQYLVDRGDLSPDSLELFSAGE